MPVRVRRANARTPDKKRADIAGDLWIPCVGKEIVYTIEVEYPATLRGYCCRIPARRPDSAGCQIDRTDRGIEKNLDALSQPAAVDRRVVLRLAFEPSWQDDPGHLRGRSGNVCAVDITGCKRYAHVVLYYQL